MTRIPYANIDELPQKISDFYKKMGGDEAGNRHLFKVAAQSNGSVRELIRLGNRLLFRNHLEPRFRELAILRVAQLHGASYEWAHHVPIALGTGLSREQIKAIGEWRESSLLTESDRMVLKYTEEVLRDSEPQDDTFTAASQFLDFASLVELTLSIGYWSMVGKFLRTFQVDIEEEFLQEHAELLQDVGMG